MTGVTLHNKDDEAWLPGYCANLEYLSIKNLFAQSIENMGYADKVSMSHG